MERVVLPFTAIVGQEKLKKALILNAINQRLMGVLIRGERGTAKSTAVRALAELLPETEVVAGCPFSCHPRDPLLQCEICKERRKEGDLPVERRKMRVVDLPLGATEDRVIGTLDVEKAIKEGIKALQPGILAEVNQGILYIDEVNLLDDHIVDVLLDVAAMGVNVIEREGISLSHPSRFILVGTMNPEEGEIRPQLLDRFGLVVDVEGIKEIDERVEVIKVVEEFELDPEGFLKKYEKEQMSLRKRIKEAQKLLRKVEIPEELLVKIALLCLELGVDGHRADFLIARTARTIAAYNLRKRVTDEDVKEAAELVLPHRMKRKPFEEPPSLKEKLEFFFQEGVRSHFNKGDEEGEEKGKENPKEEIFHIGREFKIPIKPPKDRKLRIGSGRRAKTRTSLSGKYIKSKMPEDKPVDIAIDATIRASLIRSGKLDIKSEDIREKIREKKVSSVIVFVVDASGSMSAGRRMEAAKGAVMSILKESYQKRDRVGFVAFRGRKAEVLLPPTRSVELAAKHLKELPTGGRTPLPDGLLKGLELIKMELKKNRNLVPIMVLVSDGRGNVPIRTDARLESLEVAEEIRRNGIKLLVIDAEEGFMNLGYSREIAERAGGEYKRLEELEPAEIVKAIKPLMG